MCPVSSDLDFVLVKCDYTAQTDLLCKAEVQHGLLRRERWGGWKTVLA